MNNPSIFVFPQKNRYKIPVEAPDFRSEILTDYSLISIFRRLFLAATANIDAFTARSAQKNPLFQPPNTADGDLTPSNVLARLWQSAEYWQMVDGMKDLYRIGRLCLSSLFQICALFQFLYAQTKNRDLLWLLDHIGKTMEELVTCPFMDIVDLRIPFEKLQLLGQDLQEEVGTLLPEVAPLLGIIHSAPALHDTLAQAAEIMELDASPNSHLISLLLPDLSIGPKLDYYALCTPLLSALQAYSTGSERIKSIANKLGFDLSQFSFGTRSSEKFGLITMLSAINSCCTLRYFYIDRERSLRMPSIALECNVVLTLLYDQDTTVPFELPLRVSVNGYDFRRRATYRLQRLQQSPAALDTILDAIKETAPNIRQIQHQNDSADVKRTVQNMISSTVSQRNTAIFTSLWNEFMFEIGFNAADAHIHSIEVNASQYRYFISLAAPALVALDAFGREIMRSQTLEDFLPACIEATAHDHVCTTLMKKLRFHDLDNHLLSFFTPTLSLPKLLHGKSYADILSINGIEPTTAGPDRSLKAFYPQIPGIVVDAGTFALSSNQAAPNFGVVKKDGDKTKFSINI
jgi:hypothetical protein